MFLSFPQTSCLKLSGQMQCVQGSKQLGSYSAWVNKCQTACGGKWYINQVTHAAATCCTPLSIYYLLHKPAFSFEVCAGQLQVCCWRMLAKIAEGKKQAGGNINFSSYLLDRILPQCQRSSYSHLSFPQTYCFASNSLHSCRTPLYLLYGLIAY